MARNINSLPPSRIASVRSTQQISGFGINRDAFTITPIAFHADLVATLLQKLDGIRRQTNTLNVNFIRLPLMMKARSVHRRLDVQPKVHHTQQDVGDGGNNAWSARRPEHQKQLAVFENNSWRHGAQGALARPDGVGFALYQS